MEEKGLRITFKGDGETVLRQIPAEGAELSSGSLVIAYTGEAEGSDADITVPSVSGKSYSQAKSALEKSGLSIAIEGNIQPEELEEGSLAVSQQPEAGTVVQNGSTVYVTFGVNDE